MFKDMETGEVKTRKQWIRELNKEARESMADNAYNGTDLFMALREDGILVEV